MRVTCKHIATLTLDPKVVLTARGDRPMSLKSLEKDCWRAMRGRSSATTTHVRMQERLIPRVCKTPRWRGWGAEAEISRVTEALDKQFHRPTSLVRKSQGTVCSHLTYPKKRYTFLENTQAFLKVITHRLICSFSISFLFCLKLLGFSAIYF